MATLATLRTRLLNTVGLYGAVPTAQVHASILYALNDALTGLARKRKWYWWLTKDTTTMAGLVAGATTSALPADCGRVEHIIDPEGKPVESKTPQRQADYPTLIGESTTNQTYAMGGINSSTHAKSVLWRPALLTGGDYVVWYYRLPAALSADSDEPDLPEEHHDYLYWAALQQVFLGDEERGQLIDRAKAEAMERFQEMEHDHARSIETLTRRIYATA